MKGFYKVDVTVRFQESNVTGSVDPRRWTKRFDWVVAASPAVDHRQLVTDCPFDPVEHPAAASAVHHRRHPPPDRSLLNPYFNMNR